MCRLFAARADRPVSAWGALVEAPHALRAQSCCDLRGECHESGWGVGYYQEGRLVRVRSARPAKGDPLYEQAARAAVGTILLGHVRQASVGSVGEANTHPFTFGRWLFAHNGTVQGFAERPEPLLRLVPEHLLRQVEGQTDSEHVFYLLLGRLEGEMGSLECKADADLLGRVMAEAVGELATLYPGTAEGPTRLNLVLTDGAALAASRWGHTLHRCEQRGAGLFGAAHAVAVASEALTADGWQEVPDRSVVVIRPDLSWAVS